MEHYGCIYENNHLITLLIDPKDGSIADANKAACSFYGYSLKQLKKLNISDLHTSNADPVNPGFLTQALGVERKGAGANRIFQLRHRLADGRDVDVEVHTGSIIMLGRDLLYTVIHDISDRVRSERLLKESEERYREVVELCPDAILVHRNGTIVFANKRSEALFGARKDKLVGNRLEDYLTDSGMSSQEYRKMLRLKTLRKNANLQVSVVRHDGRSFDLEIAGAPITFRSEPAVQLVLRDVTGSRQEIRRAVQLQERHFAGDFPLPGRAEFTKLYVPAETLSGDFYFFHRISDDEVIGLIGDVMGKGISAALGISAVRMLFSDLALRIHDPVRLLSELNRRVLKHMEEDYFSTLCFHMNFTQGLLNASGAGINEFIHRTRDGAVKKLTVPGAPVGMFPHSIFESTVVPFVPGDHLCFYSDGLELLDGGAEGERRYWDYDSLKLAIHESVLKDDCTWLNLLIK
ncbi:PAS domain S-box protein [Paenibacillus sp. HN-1]|uniref:PAS domain S-box protein n=1 Tax=Paenibacillus TaxID=44249 RepID=UPI001CA9832C|nr:MULTISPECIES: PAS domain S-box protein [Paenibacillus]MBY9079226.1 PAS domain S-box protein [Paenibacillus sp. CGMCC 1.18879]MBY9086949.1 PAS domain S-box protein [Paenibacillus sinensis]